MKLRDGQWIVGPAEPDATALGSAAIDAAPTKSSAGDDAVMLDSFDQLESVST